MLLVGLGNRLRGDDGVGPEVARRVAAAGADVDVLVCDGDPAALLEAWQERKRVVVIDALAGRPPGEVVRLDVGEGDALVPEAAATSHALGLAEMVELGRRLKRMPCSLVVYGVAGSTFATGAALSPAVAAAVPEVSRRVLEEAGA